MGLWSFGAVSGPVVSRGFPRQSFEGFVERTFRTESSAEGNLQYGLVNILGTGQPFFDFLNAVVVENIGEGFSDFIVDDPGQLMGGDGQPLCENVERQDVIPVDFFHLENVEQTFFDLLNTIFR